MKAKFWQTNRFITLEKEWYKKLEKENFKDIESGLSGKTVLKQRASNSYRGALQIEIENKLRYYELIGLCLHDEDSFKDDVELLVMQRKAAGFKQVSICKELKSLGKRCSKWTVWRIIRKYEKKWLIKKR